MASRKGPVIDRRVLRRVGHDPHPLEAGLVQRAADGADAAVHHVRGRDHVAAGLGLHQRLAAEHVDRLVVDHVAVADQPVVAVAGVGVERHVADHAHLGHRRLDRAHRLAHQVVGIQRLVAVRGLGCRRRLRKDRKCRDAEVAGSTRLLGQYVCAKPVDPRHGVHRLAPALALADEHGPDQIARREHRLRHQAARPVVAPVAAHTGLGIAPEGAHTLDHDILCNSGRCARGADHSQPGVRPPAVAPASPAIATGGTHRHAPPSTVAAPLASRVMRPAGQPLRLREEESHGG